MSMLNLKQAWKIPKHVNHRDRIAITSIKSGYIMMCVGFTNSGQVFILPLNLPGWWHLSLVEITRSTSGSLWCLATSIRKSLTCRLNSAYPAISPTTNISPPIICTRRRPSDKFYNKTRTRKRDKVYGQSPSFWRMWHQKRYEVFGVMMILCSRAINIDTLWDVWWLISETSCSSS